MFRLKGHCHRRGHRPTRAILTPSRRLSGTGLFDLNDKQNPDQNQKVHDNEDTSDPGFAGFGGAGADVVETVTVLALAELTFDGDAFTRILASLLEVSLIGEVEKFWRPAQGLSGKPYPPSP